MPTFHTSHSLSYCLLQVFDFHHQKFCPGDFNEKEALLAAVATWPSGVRPVVHWSESEEGRRPHAHSDYITVSISYASSPACPAYQISGAVQGGGRPAIDHMGAQRAQLYGAAAQLLFSQFRASIEVRSICC